MSGFYEGVADTASSLIREFGAAGTLTRSAGTYSPSTGIASTSDTTQSVFAALFPYGDKYIDGALILASDRKALISVAAATAPQPGDKLTWGSESFTVVNAKNLAPARVNCIYQCQVRA